MFGKYFKHVLVMTILAGSAYSLPQVKDAMVGAFGFSDTNEALVLNYSASNTMPMRQNMFELPPPTRVERPTEQIFERKVISSEETVYILTKAGIIPQNKVGQALKVLEDHANTNSKVYIPHATTTNMDREVKEIPNRQPVLINKGGVATGTPARMEDRQRMLISN